MTLSAIAKRYADALADIVTRPGADPAPAAAAAELRLFADTLESSRELREALATPAVPLGRKKAVLGRIADALRLSRITRNFLFVLADHRRITALPEIVRSFETAIDERLGFARADVSAACEMSATQQAALAAALERLTCKRIRMKIAVDEALVGGVVARIGSTVYDGSVRGQLSALGRRMGAED